MATRLDGDGDADDDADDRYVALCVSFSFIIIRDGNCKSLPPVANSLWLTAYTEFLLYL